MAFYQILLLLLKSIQLLQKGRWSPLDHCKGINQYQITTHSVLVTSSSSSLCDSLHERYPPVCIHTMHMNSNILATSPPASPLPISLVPHSLWEAGNKDKPKGPTPHTTRNPPKCQNKHMVTNPAQFQTIIRTLISCGVSVRL